MSERSDAWDGERVRTWLESRLAASLDEQGRADRRKVIKMTKTNTGFGNVSRYQ